MTVNIYDDLNKLESTFRKTAEFAEVQEAVSVVIADEEALALFKNFRKIQLDMQEKQMAGEEINPEELEYAQKTAQLAQTNEKIMGMLESEMKLSGLIEEVNRVLMKPVQEIYESI
ncbi:YlbF family regulator [Sporosarcina sp. G11-34]|uniref:YlbF family regulator n=1 Tax=Sporosarcina sp. G11-34 TaxID=2849605 RepID=UPI0022A9952E|nr:YlbF family regulator [Sporosarcina sp. G11-34]MCZ2260038.1 YlbF family regulator [Sporosarcina sp. G11-34]